MTETPKTSHHRITNAGDQSNVPNVAEGVTAGGALRKRPHTLTPLPQVRLFISLLLTS